MAINHQTKDKTLAVMHGDITTIAADGIVNSANETLLPGGGVSGAIHQMAGDTVAQECKKYYKKHGKQSAGAVVPTKAGKLQAQYILHAVGPRWQGGNKNEASLLNETYQNIIATADTLKLKTISIPAISVGIFAFPLQQATEIAIRTLIAALTQAQYVENILLICFDQKITQTYETFLKQAQLTTQLKLVSLAPGYNSL